jgi:hypothetical protein
VGFLFSIVEFSDVLHRSLESYYVLAINYNDTFFFIVLTIFQEKFEDTKLVISLNKNP